MYIKKKEESPRYKRDNIESFLLVSQKTTNSNKLVITLVEIQPGGFQHVHYHQPEQMYYILEGEGIMTVDDEEKEVKQGDCIFFPSYSKHGLKNTGNTILKYLSAASPSFSKEECNKLWPLKSYNEELNNG